MTISSPDVPVSRRINGERLVVLGWPRAILLQLAHPLIAAGVANHSSFRASPIEAARRLHQTVHAMLALTFGTPDTRARTIAAIRAIHDRVHGTLRESVGGFPAGTPYSAHDPALLLWVHATVLHSNVLAYDALVTPVSTDERDAFCLEAVDTAVGLGVDASSVPRSWHALEGCVQSTLDSGVLCVGTDARVVAAAVLRGPGRFGSPLGWINRRVTLNWLPAEVRGLYGFDWSAQDARRGARIVATLRHLRRRLPRAVACWPDARA